MGIVIWPDWPWPLPPLDPPAPLPPPAPSESPDETSVSRPDPSVSQNAPSMPHFRPMPPPPARRKLEMPQSLSRLFNGRFVV